LAFVNPSHFIDVSWSRVTRQIHDHIAQRGLHPAVCVVLVPYAQLMQQARMAWAAQGTASFVPRFETTQNWANSLQAPQDGPFEPAVSDIRMDAACDLLTAAGLLERAGLGAHKDLLAARLVESAWSVARLAAALPPDQRPEWGQRLGGLLAAGMDAPLLVLESAVGQIALAWASTSAYPTDVLFSATGDLLVVLEGFQADPLTVALKTQWGERAVTLRLVDDASPSPDPNAVQTPTPALQLAQDAEDEAQRATACVLARLGQGCLPVALVAQDRVLTRRVRAMLANKGVAVRDETGWKLSTTRSAAALMSLLRAATWDASTDAMLDWLKNAPVFDAAAVTMAEIELRKIGVREWRSVSHAETASLSASAALAARAAPLLATLQSGKPLMLWLRALRGALQASQQWESLLSDTAGQALMDALRLREGLETEFESFAARISLRDFTAWANQVLESASFTPEHPPEAQVVILPLSQLLGRPMQAVVFPGADENRLPVSPEPPGQWTPAQRALLGLPSREALALAARTAWLYTLQFNPVDVLWRNSEGGERIMASGFVQALLLAPKVELAADVRLQRALTLLPSTMPAPTGQTLPVTRLSASAYEDLRRCPYRFFAMRQLKLQAVEELEGELGKRDFGNWLHALLSHFHVALKQSPTTVAAERLLMMNQAAERSTQELALADSEFLPFAAAWPRVRAGYLLWLTGHEASGAQFSEAEQWTEMPIGPLTLIGKIDRIDRLPDGEPIVMDYKTEARGTTSARIGDPQEDTQLPFYAALLSDDPLRAAYVNLGEKEPTKSYDQEAIVDLRDDLIDSILSDMSRIAEGAKLPAMGEGKACDFCDARGLCRRDFRVAA
jgi:ATP-dependent helicase/nuclease subunit B